MPTPTYDRATLTTSEEQATQMPRGRVADAPQPGVKWGAVAALALGVFAMVTAEFLPASLLTPMAEDLGVTVGAAGRLSPPPR